MVLIRKAVKRSAMTSGSEFVLIKGKNALSVEGVERIYLALTGKQLTPLERKSVQEKIDSFLARSGAAFSD